MRSANLNRWSLEDVRALRLLAEQGLPADRIASRLQRSESSVRNKAGMHGISLKVLKGQTSAGAARDLVIEIGR